MTAQRNRTQSVMDAIQSQIASRALPAGARLPSVRVQAKAMGVSVSTVVEGYERLAAQGTITARRGSGFYVAGPTAPLTLARMAPELDRDIDPMWVSRQSLQVDPATLKPGCGWLPPEFMYEDGLRRALRSVARAETSLLTDYTTAHGLPAMRQLLARRIASLNIDAPPEQIMLTSSGTQAIDLICRFLLEPGDTVLVDDPCYFNFHALLRAHRVKAVGVPYTPTGPDLTAFAAALREHAPRLYITNSGLHNPTGAALSPVCAHRLLQLAEAADLVIVEDDIYADFETSPAPRLAAFDGLSRVIHIGSFSKTLSASLRCGYIAARADWLEGLIDLKIATHFGGGQLAAAVLHRALIDSGYRKHMQAVRSRLAAAMERTLQRLAPLGIEPWHVPQAGMFLWCRLPERVNAAHITRTCLQHQVLLAPGNAFSQSHSAEDFLRFNVAQCGNRKIFDVLARALESR